MEIIQRTTLWDARKWNKFWIHTEKLVVCWSHCTYLILLWFSSKKQHVSCVDESQLKEEYYRLLQKFENLSPCLRTQGESSRTVRRNEEQKRNEGCQHHSRNHVLPTEIHVEISIKCRYSTLFPKIQNLESSNRNSKKDIDHCSPILHKDNFFKWLKNPIKFW